MGQKARLKTETQMPVPGQSTDFVLEAYVGHLLRKSSQRASEIFQHIMGDFDVTPTQFAALVKLDDEGEVSQNVLGRLTAMDPATILGVVSRLKRRGLVDSRLDPDDGRRILLRLTDTGLGLVGDMKAVAGNVTIETLAPLTKAESQTFIRLLQKLA
ncbi:MAG: MarR family winged helix-turn-helix transcriptional regulator [Rhizobiaceae bacterium]